MANKNIKKLILKTAGNNFVADIENIENRISNKLDKSGVVQGTGTSTTQVMSQKSVTDALQGKLDKSDAVHITGNESISGVKTFTNPTKMKDVSVSGSIFKETTDSSLLLLNGTANTGAYVVLHGSDHAPYQGYFDISARTDSGTVSKLIGTPNGSLTWNNKEISTKEYVDTEKAKYLPLTGGSITGDIQHQVSQRTFNINSGVGAQGAGLQLFPDDSTQGDLQGAFALYSQVKAGNNYFLIGKNNGCLYWNGSQVMTVGVGTTVTGVNNFSNGLKINGHSVTIG